MTRYSAKKLARSTIALASWASGSLSARSLISRGPRVRALTYHSLTHCEARDAFRVDPDVFDEHMRVLAETRSAVSLAQVRRFLAGEEDLIAADACLVTIDDGLSSTLTEALPILERWGVPAVAFISVGLVGARNVVPEDHMSWDELRSLARTGLVTVGSHGYSHRSIGMLPPAVARDEVRRSRDLLESRLGVEVTSFAYPFGTIGDFTPETDQALADAGYTIAFHSVHGAIERGDAPISLPRVKVESGESLFMFQLLRRGALDPWWAVDRALYFLQRARDEQPADGVGDRDEQPADGAGELDEELPSEIAVAAGARRRRA